MKTTNRLLAISAFVLAVFGILVTSNLVLAADKVTICHATGSLTNPYTQIVVSENAIGGHFENNGTPKDGHEDDLLFEGEVVCPGTEQPTLTQQPTPSIQQPTPTDNEEDQEDEEGATIIEGNIDICAVRGCPTLTQQPTPSIQQPTPTMTPAPTSTPVPTTPPSTGGGSSSGGSSSSSPSSSTGGSVQGATTTLATTGVFSDTLMNMVGLAGVALTGLSAARYGKKS